MSIGRSDISRTYWNCVFSLSLLDTGQKCCLILTNWALHRDGTRRSGGRYPRIPNLPSIGGEGSGICSGRFVSTESAARKSWPPEPIWTERREKSLVLRGIEPRFFGSFRNNLVSSLKKLYMEFSKQKFTLQLDGFGGLVVSMLASGTQVCGFKPGRSRWVFRT